MGLLLMLVYIVMVVILKFTMRKGNM